MGGVASTEGRLTERQREKKSADFQTLMDPTVMEYPHSWAGVFSIHGSVGAAAAAAEAWNVQWGRMGKERLGRQTSGSERMIAVIGI